VNTSFNNNQQKIKFSLAANKIYPQLSESHFFFSKKVIFAQIKRSSLNTHTQLKDHHDRLLFPSQGRKKAMPDARIGFSLLFSLKKLPLNN
jgi:hypothetical protein